MFSVIAQPVAVAAVASALLGFHALPLQAQASAGSRISATQADISKPKQALRVFLDCPDVQSGCALDYFVVELPFADWTRDRLFADVQLLVSTLTTGSGAGSTPS
jgi:hypothetical protein